MTQEQRATIEAWLIRAQESLRANQNGPALIQIEAALQALYAIGEKRE